MKKFNCPSCGAEVVFNSNHSVYAVCKYCHSMIVRHDLDVEAIGTMASLPEDMSPFQIGTEGYYQGTHFSLVGRDGDLRQSRGSAVRHARIERGVRGNKQVGDVAVDGGPLVL